MTEIVRKLSTGIVGLDIALGGGWRITRRIANDERQSATMLIRGGPGTGKSALASDLALRLAGQLGGDVVYACVELLPQELVAQRAGFDGFDERAVIDLSTKAHKNVAVEGPTLAVGLHPLEMARDQEAPEGAPLVPDVGEMLLRLAGIARERGCTPRVVVLDSLIEGYGLGSTSSRYVVDGVCKLAIEQGWVLILIEEVTDDRPSPWAFAVDTVISLRLIERDGLNERELSVTKHRFGPCEPGPHRLRIDPERIRVIPPIEAYREAHRYLTLPRPANGRAVLREFKSAALLPADLSVPDGSGQLVAIIGNDESPARPWLFRPPQYRDSRGERHIVFEVPDLFDRNDEWLETATHGVSAIRGEVDRIAVVVFVSSPISARAIQTCIRLLVRWGYLVFYWQEDGKLDQLGSLQIAVSSTTLTTERRTPNQLRIDVAGAKQGRVEITIE